MTAFPRKSKGNKAGQASGSRFLEITLSPVEAGYIRLLSAVLQESEEEVVTDLLSGRFKPALR